MKQFADIILKVRPMITMIFWAAGAMTAFCFLFLFLLHRID